jgi:hypothetical protein
MRPPRGTAYPRGQRVPPRLLLTDRDRRPHRGRMHLRGVLVLRPQDQSPGSRPPNDSGHMAFCRVRAGHRRALAKGARGLHPPASRHR